MEKSGILTRRAFLHRSAAALTIPAFVPSSVLAAPGPNERIGIGMIGVGRRAGELMRSLTKDAQIVAISDINQERLDRLTAKRDWKAFTNYRELLELDEVDAVMVATPDHWHTAPSLHACQAGKDVYCEKPLTLTIREGRLLVQAARKYKRIFQIGSQQRSMEPSRIGCELVRNQRLGKVHTVHGNNYPSPWTQAFPTQPVPKGLDWDVWMGQTAVRGYHEDIYLPRAKPGWISLQPYSGGEMTGWGSHGLDMVQWALGTDQTGPVEVWPVGEGTTCQVHYRYANGIVLKLDNKGPAGGARFVGEDGDVLVDRNKYEANPMEIAKEPASGSEQRLYVSRHHQQNWLDCIRSREAPIADVEMGHRSATMCHLGNIARWVGRKLQWDPDKEIFPGDDEANGYIARPQRAPYQLPEV